MLKGECNVNNDEGIIDVTELELTDEDEGLILSDMEVISLGNYLLDARNAINQALEIIGVEESDGSELEGIVKV